MLSHEINKTNYDIFAPKVMFLLTWFEVPVQCELCFGNTEPSPKTASQKC